MSAPTNRADVIRAKGCPGGGKTHWIFSTLADLVDDGVSYDDVYVLTFTNAGKAEATEKLRELFNADRMSNENARRVERRAKTVHGAACSVALGAGVINDVGEQVIDTNNATDVYARFCDQQSLGFAPETRNPLEEASHGRSINETGNRLFGINQWLKLSRKTPDDVTDASLQRPAGIVQTTELLQAWNDFKRDGDANGRGVQLFEHTDYVDEVIDGHHAPDVRYMFIDEFQDLSPQEYLLFKRWRDSGDIERIYIAGDYAQSIYSFRAADPYYFRETPVTDEVDLTRSQRCPSAITSVGNGVLANGPGNTDADGVHIRTNLIGGSATRERIETASELTSRVITDVARSGHEPNDKGNSVFLLARTNKQVRKISRALDGAGIPYGVIGRPDWQQPWCAPMPALLKGLRKVATGRDIQYMPSIVAETFETYYNGSAKTTIELADHRPEDVISRLTGHPEDKPQKKLSKRDRDRLRHAVINDVTADPGRYADRVQIGTIHAAKGLEAPCVYLFDGYSAKLKQEYYSSRGTQAEEHRVYYVGVTRASKTLVVATGYENMGTAVFPGFEHGLPRVENEWGAPDAGRNGTEVSE